MVDYKTGKKAFDLTDVRYGLGIQMLLYLFTLQKEGGAYFGRPVEPAGVLYMPARDIILRADRAVPPDKLEDMLRRELRRTGMLLGEPEVLTAMEHSALDAPCYLPVGTTKDGAVQGLLQPLGPRAAVCVQAALFAVQHGGAAGIAYALVLGVLLGTIRQRTGRVWPGWVLHTVNNLLVFAAG